MKIIVQGKIIDTENIRLIEDIYECSYHCFLRYNFSIHLFEGKKIEISNIFNFKDEMDAKVKERGGDSTSTMGQNILEKYVAQGILIAPSEKIIKINETVKNELNDLRNRIVAIWRDNKLKLESFDIIKQTT